MVQNIVNANAQAENLIQGLMSKGGNESALESVFKMTDMFQQVLTEASAYMDLPQPATQASRQDEEEEAKRLSLELEEKQRRKEAKQAEEAK